MLQVPLDKSRNETFEDFSMTAPADREKAFGQFDHVRVYGIDYKDRLDKAGFTVEKINFKDTYTPNEIFRYGLLDEDAHICHKSGNSQVLFCRQKKAEQDCVV